MTWSVYALSNFLHCSRRYRIHDPDIWTKSCRDILNLKDGAWLLRNRAKLHSLYRAKHLSILRFFGWIRRVEVVQKISYRSRHARHSVAGVLEYCRLSVNPPLRGGPRQFQGVVRFEQCQPNETRELVMKQRYPGAPGCEVRFVSGDDYSAVAQNVPSSFLSCSLTGGRDSSNECYFDIVLREAVLRGLEII